MAVLSVGKSRAEFGSLARAACHCVRIFCLMFGGFVFSLLLGESSRAQAAVSPEYAVKANYLYKFTPFVEWPASAFSSRASAFQLCLFGDDPFGSVLEDVVRGRTVGDHPIAVRRITNPESATNCHMLYISKLPAHDDVLKAVAGRPVLTVTDHGGGIIQFVVQDSHVRFDIDEAGAQASKITLSSKLISLAVSHRRDSQ
jgi:hypothetical protein